MKENKQLEQEKEVRLTTGGGGGGWGWGWWGEGSHGHHDTVNTSFIGIEAPSTPKVNRQGAASYFLRSTVTAESWRQNKC